MSLWKNINFSLSLSLSLLVCFSSCIFFQLRSAVSAPAGGKLLSARSPKKHVKHLPKSLQTRSRLRGLCSHITHSLKPKAVLMSYNPKDKGSLKSLRFSKEAFGCIEFRFFRFWILVKHQYINGFLKDGSPVTLILTEMFKSSTYDFLISISRKLDHLCQTNTIKWRTYNATSRTLNICKEPLRNLF